MIQASLRLARFRGIEVGVHYSWFVVVVLITVSLARAFGENYASWTTAELYLIALLASLLFFGCIVLHELAHSLVALANGIPVRSITLFVFGGVARMSREPDRPLTEFQIAIAGPVMSLGLAMGFALLARGAAEVSEPLQAMADWLAHVNFVLALFNLLPGFPLDGGRVLRAAAWWLTGNFARAMRIASACGRFLGGALIVFGIMIGITAEWLGGLWLALIGWFLLQAAREGLLQMSLKRSLGNLVAKEVMVQDFPTVPGSLSVEQLVDDHILRTGQRSFLVSENGDRLGLITLHQVKAIPRNQWAGTPVGTAMTPLTRLRVVAPETPVLEVLEILDKADVNQVPVMRDGRSVGMITRDRIIRILLTQMELDESVRSAGVEHDSAAACVGG